MAQPCLDCHLALASEHRIALAAPTARQGWGLVFPASVESGIPLLAVYANPIGPVLPIRLNRDRSTLRLTGGESCEG